MTAVVTWPFSAQQRWRHDAMLRPGGPAPRTVVAGIELAAPVPPAALRHALDMVARAHPVLRGSVVAESGEPRLRIAAEPSTELAVEDVAHGTLDSAVARYGDAPFDRGGPLWRAALLAEPGGRQAIALAFHPLVADGVSAGIVLRDVAAGSARDAAPYDAFVAWQAARYGACDGPALEFWRDLLHGVAVDRPFPLGNPRAEPAGAERTQRAVTPDAGPFVARLAALVAAAGHVTGAADISVRVAVHGRPSGFERTVGVFANEVVVRVHDATAGAGPVLDEVRATWRGVMAHQHAPYPWVLRCVGADLVTVTEHRPPELTVVVPAVGAGTPLAGAAYADPAGLVVTLAPREAAATYDAARFDDGDVGALLTSYAAILRA